MTLFDRFRAITQEPEDEQPTAVPGPTDQPAPLPPETGGVQVTNPLPGQHQPGDGSGFGFDTAIPAPPPIPETTSELVPDLYDFDGPNGPGGVPQPTDQGAPTDDPNVFQGTDVEDTPNPFGEGTFGFDAYQDGLSQNRTNTDALNQAASDFAIGGYGDFSRWDNNLVQQGLSTIQDTLARLGREGTNSIEATLANRGLTGSSVEADQLKDLQLGLNEQANQFGFNLAREMANTYANDRATQADIGLATAGLLGQTESDRFGQDFSLYGRDLDENFRRTAFGADEDYRRDVLGLNEGFRRDQLGLDRDRFGFSQDLAREAAFLDRFGLAGGLAGEYPGSIDPDTLARFLYGDFGFGDQFGLEFGGGGGGFSGGGDTGSGGGGFDPQQPIGPNNFPEPPTPNAPPEAFQPGTDSNAARQALFQAFGISGPEDIGRLSDFQRNALEIYLARLEAAGY